jgi:CubicO group peptidase (beta-lactamase class C family)
VALSLLGLGNASGGADPSPGPQAVAVTKTVRDLAKQYALNATVYGVWRDGKPVAVGSLGSASPGVPATVNDHFRTGNTIEAMTSTLLLQLVDQRKLSLDDKISKWFPTLPHASEVTVGQLASSTSGYVHYVNVPAFLDAFHADVFADWTPDELVKYSIDANGGQLLFPPGTSWSFSDTGFVLIGEIIERVGQAPLGVQLQQRIFRPLGMRDSLVPTGTEFPAPVLHGYSGERGVWEDVTYWNPSWAPGTGNAISDVTDLGRWANALGRGALISKRAHAAQLSPKTIGLGPLTKDFYYGLGVGISHGWVFSAPGLLGETGIVASLPSQRLTIVVYTTSGQSSPEGTHYAGVTFTALAKLLSPGNVPAFPGA